MAMSEKLQALKTSRFSSFSSPPKPEEAPRTMAKSEVIPEEGSLVIEPKHNVEASIAASDVEHAVAKSKPKRKAASKKTGNGTVREGYVQMNCRVLEEVHRAIKIDCVTHGKDKGEILTEAYQLWKKKYG